jgi:hypothetical protein
VFDEGDMSSEPFELLIFWMDLEKSKRGPCYKVYLKYIDWATGGDSSFFFLTFVSLSHIS